MTLEDFKDFERQLETDTELVKKLVNTYNL